MDLLLASEGLHACVAGTLMRRLPCLHAAPAVAGFRAGSSPLCLQGTLPLDPARLSRLAVIGPFADAAENLLGWVARSSTAGLARGVQVVFCT